MTYHFYNRALFLSSALGLLTMCWLILPASKLEANQETISPTEIIPIEKVFPAVNLTAKSALVLDLNQNKILFSKNPDDQLPLASITKIMTARLAEKYLNPQTTITIISGDLSGGSNAGLLVGESWSVKNLIDYTLITSANGGASALARAVEKTTGQDFIDLMNEEAENLRLDNTYFVNPTGLDVGANYGGSYGTARDITNLLVQVMSDNPELMSATAKSQIKIPALSGKIYSGQNTNNIAGELVGLMASKTGFTYQAGGNLAVVVDVGLRQPVIIVALNSTRDNRFDDVLNLTKATVKFFAD